MSTRANGRKLHIATAVSAAGVLIGVIAGGAGPARAQTTAPLVATDFTLALARVDPSSGAFTALDDAGLAGFFSAARCACPTNFGVVLALSTDGAAKLLSTDSLDATIMLGSDCDNVAATACTTVGSGLTLDASTTSSSETVPTSAVFSTLASGVSCSALPASSSRLWAIVRLNGTRLTNEPSVIVGLGGTGAAAPTAVVTQTADTGLLVSWTAPAVSTGVVGYQVLCSPGPSTPPAAAFDNCAAAAPTGGTGPFATIDASQICSDLVAVGTNLVRVRGLQNGSVYQVAVVSIGSDGTSSAASVIVEGTPSPTLGFDDIYKQEGGTGLAGCAIGGARRPGQLGFGWVAVGAGALALTLVGRRRRRRRDQAARLRRALSLALALGLPLAGAHAAQATINPDEPSPGLTFGGDRLPPRESPRNWNLELRFGPYFPAVDSEFADRGDPARPFAEIFTTKKRLMVGIELDRQVSHRGGTWAVGVGLGHYQATASSLAADHVTRTGDSTSLSIIPLWVLAVYRADLLRERLGSPLIPYAKLGLGSAFWTVSDTAKTGSTSGQTLGWNAAAGVTLDLSFLDEEGVRTMDQETGVNQVGLFFEVAHSAFDGFGSASVLHLGDNTWLAGLMLEM
jgi:hypothetical protein